MSRQSGASKPNKKRASLGQKRGQHSLSAKAIYGGEDSRAPWLEATNDGNRASSGVISRTSDFVQEKLAKTDAQLSEEERGAWLVRLERQVIIPVKWLIWLMTLVYWFTLQSLIGVPDRLLFTTYVTYFTLNGGFTVLAWYFGISPKQARAFSLLSLACDLAFVMTVIYADAVQAFIVANSAGIPDPNPAFKDASLLVTLIIIRGLLVLRNAWENLIWGVVITFLVVFVSRVQTGNFGFLTEWDFAMRLGFSWLVYMFAWFLLESLLRQQRQLSRMRERLIKQENLAVLGQMTAGIAHEINNPIGIIGACADFVSGSVEAEPEVREEIETIRNEARRCRRIVQDMLDFAAPDQSRHVRPVILADVVDEALQNAIREMGIDPEVTRRYDPECPKVQADPNKLGQAIGNILRNALQHAPTENPRVDIWILEQADARDGHRYAQVLIADNGPGIKQKYRSHIFEPFYSRREGGSGLGLAIARRIVRGHGGELYLKDSPTSTGACFEFDLPIADPGNNFSDGAPSE